MLPLRRIALFLLAAPGPVAAMDLPLGNGFQSRINGTISAGTMIRTEAPDTALIGKTSAARAGLSSGQLLGNGGGADLNFQRGKPVSSLVKALVDVEVKRGEYGVFARTRAWYDHELAEGNRPYGNAPNGFRRDAPLSDAGFSPTARFSNLELADAYAFGHFKPTDRSRMEVRLGRQVVHWGASRFTTGGLDTINPLDHPAQTRPGALPQEGRIPVGMVYVNLDGGGAWGADGFLQLEHRSTVQVGCGTFFALSNYSTSGCNYVSVLPTLSDDTALASGRYPKRQADVDSSDAGQFGLSLRYTARSLATEFRAYGLRYHSRSPSVRVTNAEVNGGYGTATTRLTDANGLRYATLYPEGIQLYGLSFQSRIDDSLRAFGEVARRSGQPLNLNAADLITAFYGRSPTSALNLAKNSNAIPPGGQFDAYDRFPVTTASLGLERSFAAVLGAERLSVAGEAGFSHVENLPNPGVLRYGRPDDYGPGAVDGQPCTDTTAAQKGCSHQGFISDNAWGYRLRLSADYPDRLPDTVLTPSLAFAHDLSGFSYDGTFLEDRKVLRPALHVTWRKSWFADMAYTRIAGGAYNLLADRDNVTLVVGYTF
ncbi:MAG: DUF1302 family protein [Magnetococcales bacterium]|nr:DUF1302 family protein [Magnetococcales bacterium]